MAAVVSASSTPLAPEDNTEASSRRSIIDAFEVFRAALDDANDRRERLIKISRDVTIHSKRVIFLLHRLVASPSGGENSSTEAPGANEIRATEQAAAKEGLKKLDEMQTFFKAITKELEGQEFERFSHAISPGLQEYIEALAFAHYLQHGTLIKYKEVQARNPRIPLSYADYLLGLSDLTGELMRFATSTISVRGNGGGLSKALEVCHFVRECSADFEALTPYVRGLSKKQQVTNESLKKIEQVAYTIAIRGSEHADMTDLWTDPRPQQSQGRKRRRDDDADEDDIEMN